MSSYTNADRNGGGGDSPISINARERQPIMVTSGNYDSDDSDAPLIVDSRSQRRATFNTLSRSSISIRATLALVSTTMAVGIVSVPYIMDQTGWIGLMFVVLVALMANYTAKLLAFCMYSRAPVAGTPSMSGDRLGAITNASTAGTGGMNTGNSAKNAKFKTYYAVSAYALGKNTGMALTFLQYVSLLGAAVVYLIMCGYTIGIVFDFFGWWDPLDERWYMLVCGALLLAIVSPADTSVRLFTALSKFGIVAAAFMIVTVVVLSVQYPPDSGANERVVISPGSFLRAYSGLSFIFGVHALLPVVHSELKRAATFNRATNLATALSVTVYVLQMALIYSVYGSSSSSAASEGSGGGGSAGRDTFDGGSSDALLSTLHGMAVDTATTAGATASSSAAIEEIINLNLESSWMNTLATAFITLQAFFVMPLLLRPVLVFMDETLRVEGSSAPMVWRMVVRAAVVLLVTLVALVSPTFFPILSLFGAGPINVIAFIAPCLIHLRLNYSQISTFELVVVYTILSVAVAGGGTGIYYALYDMVTAWKDISYTE